MKLKVVLESVVLVIVIIAIIWFLKNYIFSAKNNTNTNTNGSNTTAPPSPKNYILTVVSPANYNNKYLVFNNQNNITLTDDKTQATKVNLNTDNYINLIGQSTPFPFRKIQINNKYLFITPKTNNVSEPDDNLLFSSTHFFTDESQPFLTPSTFASLYLNDKNALSANFNSDYHDVASINNGGIVFLPPVDNDNRIIINAVEV